MKWTALTLCMALGFAAGCSSENNRPAATPSTEPEPATAGSESTITPTPMTPAPVGDDTTSVPGATTATPQSDTSTGPQSSNTPPSTNMGGSQSGATAGNWDAR